MQDINWFNELFLSTDIWGWFGPIGILVISFLILTNRKLKPLGFVFILLQLLIISQYVLLVAVTPWYWWNIIILVLGMLLCIGQMTR